jgi:hypothetical protein
MVYACRDADEGRGKFGQEKFDHLVRKEKWDQLG